MAEPTQTSATSVGAMTRALRSSTRGQGLKVDSGRDGVTLHFALSWGA